MNVLLSLSSSIKGLGRGCSDTTRILLGQRGGGGREQAQNSLIR